MFKYLFQWFTRFNFIKPKVEPYAKVVHLEMPLGAGRSSVDNNALYFNTLTALQPEFGLEWLPILENLSVFHHDISRAVQNLIDFANTDYEVYFDDNVSPRMQKQMNMFLKTERNRIFKQFGEKVFISNLLRQLAISGALSSEMVVASDLRSLSEIVLVKPADIRWVLKDGQYKPYQVVSILPNGMGLGTLFGGNLNPLNEITYKYYPILQSGGTPYAIPPFISCLKLLGIEDSMLANFASITKKIGMFGFLEVLLTMPDQLENENDEEYVARCEAYRQSVAPSIKNMLNEGYVVGFEGNHQFNLAGSTTNAANADKMLEMLDTLKMSGLKQDPNMFGRHTTVTETFGRVLLAMLISQAKQYQGIVGTFLEGAYTLMLKLAGFKVGYVKIEFKEPLPGDELKKEQVISAKIDNLIKLYLQGIITQEQFAQELGYDKPASPTPLQPVTPTTASPADAHTHDNPSAKSQSEVKQSLTEAVAQLRGSLREFDYSLPEAYLRNETLTSWGDSVTERYASTYENGVSRLHDKALATAIDAVVKRAKSSKSGYADAFVGNAMLAFLSAWQNEFAEKIGDTTKKHTEETYLHYRKDKSLFPTKQDSKQSFASYPPTAHLDLVDFRALEFFKTIDNLYLGKYITDADSQKRIMDFLRNAYLENGEAIGTNEKAIEKFRKEFTDIVESEYWKVRRIIDTSVNRMRTWGNLNYMHQANVQEFKIVEVMDRITCPHCTAMNGRTFSVTTARKRIEAQVENPTALTPFITTVPVDDIKGLTDSEIQSKGFDLTPFHPHCRGRLVVN